jgi:hypothetical protein
MSSWHSSILPARLAGPLRHVHASRAPGLLRDLRPTRRPSAGNEPAPSLPWPDSGRATADGSHVHTTSIDQAGGQLYPGSLAMPTPQYFDMASPPTDSLGFGVDPHAQAPRSRAASRPVSTRFEPVLFLRSFNHWFTHVPPSDLACRTRPVWRYRTVPALSGLLPPSPALPGSGCPLLHHTAATVWRRGLSPPSMPRTSWRTNP